MALDRYCPICGNAWDDGKCERCGTAKDIPPQDDLVDQLQRALRDVLNTLYEFEGDTESVYSTIAESYDYYQSLLGKYRTGA